MKLMNILKNEKDNYENQSNNGSTLQKVWQDWRKAPRSYDVPQLLSQLVLSQEQKENERHDKVVHRSRFERII